ALPISSSPVAPKRPPGPPATHFLLPDRVFWFTYWPSEPLPPGPPSPPLPALPGFTETRTLAVRAAASIWESRGITLTTTLPPRPPLPPRAGGQLSRPPASWPAPPAPPGPPGPPSARILRLPILRASRPR